MKLVRLVTQAGEPRHHSVEDVNRLTAGSGQNAVVLDAQGVEARIAGLIEIETA